jgi:hypothetical protein
VAHTSSKRNLSGEAEQDLAKVVLEARQTADFSKVPVEINDVEIKKLKDELLE